MLSFPQLPPAYAPRGALVVLEKKEPRSPWVWARDRGSAAGPRKCREKAPFLQAGGVRKRRRGAPSLKRGCLFKIFASRVSALARGRRLRKGAPRPGARGARAPRGSWFTLADPPLDLPPLVLCYRFPGLGMGDTSPQRATYSVLDTPYSEDFTVFSAFSRLFFSEDSLSSSQREGGFIAYSEDFSVSTGFQNLCEGGALSLPPPTCYIHEI